MTYEIFFLTKIHTNIIERERGRNRLIGYDENLFSPNTNNIRKGWVVAGFLVVGTAWSCHLRLVLSIFFCLFIYFLKLFLEFIMSLLIRALLN
jgi:hypothetical protein